MEAISDLAAKCIRCGFCLESCPTFMETGNEAMSPRGRIYLAKSADEGAIPWGKDVAQPLDSCLGCRACETACPSGVEYGEILELARQRQLEAQSDWRTKMMLRILTTPPLLKVSLAGPGRRVPRFLSAEAPQADKPALQHSDWPPLRSADLPPIRGEVHLLKGCAMRVLFPGVHEATERLLRRVGFKVKPANDGCCGALHAHAGFGAEAESLQVRLASAFGDDLPIIVNSAGCGSELKKGPLSDRVFDISEFLSTQGLGEELGKSNGVSASIAYHDACHLAHGQGIRSQPRELLAAIPGVELVDLKESDVCCGSAGIYNLSQPAMARRLLERKWRNIEASGAQIVVSGNPGCHAWIAQASREHGGAIRVMHTAEVLEASFSGLTDSR